VVQDEIQLLRHEPVVPCQQPGDFIEDGAGLANPKGIPAQNPRLRGTSYLGCGYPRSHKPQRGCGTAAGDEGHNPVGVGDVFNG